MIDGEINIQIINKINMKEKQKYNNIKRILRKQVEDNLNVIWSWDKEDNHFIMVFKDIDDSLPIYTPAQLLDEIELKIKEDAKTK